LAALRSDFEGVQKKGLKIGGKWEALSKVFFIRRGRRLHHLGDICGIISEIIKGGISYD